MSLSTRDSMNMAGASHACPIPVFLMSDSFETGGTERQFVTLINALDRDQFKVHIGCLQKRGAFLGNLKDVVELRLGGNLYGIRSMHARLQLARYLRQCGAIVAHAFDFYSNLVLIPAARLARIPVVIGSQRQLGDLLSQAKSRAQAAAFHWADVVVCNSLAARHALVEQGLSREHIEVIGNGLPSSLFEITAPALPRDPSRLRIGMIARMNTRAKNHDVFLRAAASVCTRVSKVEIVLVGDGALRPRLEKLASDLGIRDRVLFLGERRDIPAVLASLDVSASPSVSESLSNVILESMAAGVSVIASRVGGNCEVISEDRGVLVNPGDEKALAQELERLLRDSSLRDRYARKAKAFAKENFSVEHMRARYEDLYLRLMHRKKHLRRS